MKYLRLFEEFDMDKIMTLSKEKPSEENQKISDRLSNLFYVEPIYGVTYAKNLKYIDYPYSGDPNDILFTFDLDLEQFDEDKAKKLINQTNWKNLYARSFNTIRADLERFKFDYSINIFIKKNGEIIFRLNSPEGKKSSDKQLENSYTKEFETSDEMFTFIESQKLPALLSKRKYKYDLLRYKGEIDKKQKDAERDDHYMRMLRDGY